MDKFDNGKFLPPPGTACWLNYPGNCGNGKCDVVGMYYHCEAVIKIMNNNNVDVPVEKLQSDKLLCPYRGFVSCHKHKCPDYQPDKTPWCLFVEQRQTPRNR